MSNSVKTKFAGLFRGLFRRSEPAEDAPESRPVTASAPAAPTTADHSDHPVAIPDLPARAPVNNDDEIALPLTPIIAGLPLELRAKIMSVPSPGQTISLPIETITAQLAFGSVKISFGELRQLAPGIFSNSAGDQDAKTISLPLGEILSRMNPALLARRARKKVEVSDDINGPFAGRGNGVVFTVQSVKPAPTAPKNVATPAPAFAAPPPRMNQPAVSTPPPPSAPIAFATPAGFDRTPPPATIGNGNGHHASPPVPKISAAPIPAPAAPRPEPSQPTIFVMISQLAESWPDELKGEISGAGFSSLKVPLAGAEVAAGLKRGRVGMTWKQLRLLARPGSPDSPNDPLELELPLKVIAPLFFAAQKNGQRTQRNTTVSEEIPNLFFGFPQPAPAPVSVPKPVEKKTSDSNYYAKADNGAAQNGEESVYALSPAPHTDFTSRQASPKEVVARAMAWPGVAGTIVTLPDGLRVASEVPSEFNADTLAAFIPQLFERMNQSAKELRMGALNNVSFTVGNVPWRIFRVNAVYLAAFGRAGESLPAAQLAVLAGELDRKKQQ